MRAAVMHRPHEPVIIEDLTLDAPAAGEVLVRIEAAGVCHSDLHYWQGDLAAHHPLVLGHEGCGIVEQVGPGVTAFAPGDKVVMLWRPRCGECEYCLSGQPALCDKGAVHGTTNELIGGGTRLSLNGETRYHLMGISCFAEQAVVPQQSLVRVPDEVPSEIAAITGCAVITGMGVVLNRLPDLTGRSVLIIGAGGVGLSAVLGAQLVGARQIIVSDVVPARLEKALELGATHVINAATQDVVAETQRITGSGAHYAVEAIGRSATITQAIHALRKGGTAVIAGLGSATDTAELPINHLVQQGKRIDGSLYGSSNTPVQVPEILDLYLAGRLSLDRLIDRSYRLEEIDEALASLTSGAIGRPVILPQSGATS
ncbi:alcohol dehydrogenase catalytic domain-containing protein [Pseudoclavibacter soli]|uniref:alcohol dehydrogenase catalytic domain-containing protein n=1 Tax=Pseudoclavibacter soli TaxID=452623 RepID=UPI000482F3BB|nr:Zn-dependent alcohol dehydrogenase [Pseudoclavibacter soli]